MELLLVCVGDKLVKLGNQGFRGEKRKFVAGRLKVLPAKLALIV